MFLISRGCVRLCRLEVTGGSGPVNKPTIPSFPNSLAPLATTSDGDQQPLKGNEGLEIV